jgi:ubiquinone/menaquinone biosynthesis C-methylase UbiE
MGCGAGDVPIVAAELVGPSGSVVGIDRNPQVIAIAGERAQAARLRRVAVDKAFFNLVVGRHILIHQPDPAALLRATARLVKPGGSVAFHEFRLRQKCYSVPNVPLFELIDKLIRMAFSGALPNYDAGDRLIQHFSDAGLPHLFTETQIWAGAHAFCSWMVGILRSLLPQLQRMGNLAGGICW